MNSKICLYFHPMTRSTRPRWLLEELGIPYELKILDMNSNEHKSPEYMKIHPHGSVPALQDGDIIIFESAAICMYLADKFPEKGLAPALNTPERAYYYQWMFYSMATMENPVYTIFQQTMRMPEDQRMPSLIEPARQRLNECFGVLEAELSKHPFLLGENFSAADVMVGSIVVWAGFMGLVEGYPQVEQYRKRLTARDAYKRARA